MKVLYLCREIEDDFLCLGLWDGLQQVLGEENVFDAIGSKNLHADLNGEIIYDGDGAKTFTTIGIWRCLGAERY